VLDESLLDSQVGTLEAWGLGSLLVGEQASLTTSAPTANWDAMED